jgi:hypothetical protein
MSQSLNIVPAFDGMNYGYWKARMQFFLKSIDCWSIVETGWTKPVDATLELVIEKNVQLSNDKALHALCQALSPSEFPRTSNSEFAKEAWQILETTYECTKLVKSAKLQMLIFKFEEIKMLEDETFGKFYSKMSDLRNSMVSLMKTVSDVKLIRKIRRRLDGRHKASGRITVRSAFQNFTEILSIFESRPDDVALSSERSHFSYMQFPYQGFTRPDQGNGRSDG